MMVVVEASLFEAIPTVAKIADNSLHRKESTMFPTCLLFEVEAFG